MSLEFEAAGLATSLALDIALTIQNILIASLEPIWVKIADFGAAKHLEGTWRHTQVGTHGYLAPELLGIFSHNRKGNLYTNAVDLWALGSIVYEMFTSQIPFTVSTTALDSNGLCFPQTDMELLSRFCSSAIPLPQEGLQSCGANDHAIAFIKGLLLPDPASRLSASAALQTAWLLTTGDMGNNSTVVVQANDTSNLFMYYHYLPESFWV